MNEKVLQLIKGKEIYYPYALEEQFPHMLNRIIELWDSPELGAYLEQLMLDSRDHQRQGFPPEVATDIMRLGRINSEQHNHTTTRLIG